LNEFPDYNGDRKAGKKNLVVRLGLDPAAQIYGVVTVLAWTFLMVGLFFGVPLCLAILATPLYLMGGKIYLELRRRAYRESSVLKRLCGFNLAINLGTTALMILCAVLCL